MKEWLKQDKLDLLTKWSSNGLSYKDIADYVKEYINSLGGFEKFAEWGIQY